MGRRVKEGFLDSNKEMDVGGVIVSPSTLASASVASLTSSKQHERFFSMNHAVSTGLEELSRKPEFYAIARLAVLIGESVDL